MLQAGDESPSPEYNKRCSLSIEGIRNRHNVILDQVISTIGHLVPEVSMPRTTTTQLFGDIPNAGPSMAAITGMGKCCRRVTAPLSLFAMKSLLVPPCTPFHCINELTKPLILNLKPIPTPEAIVCLHAWQRRFPRIPEASWRVP